MKPSEIFKILPIIIGIVFYSCSEESVQDSDFSDDDSEPVEIVVTSATESPDEIRGIKWRQHSDDEFLQGDGSLNWWLNKPEGTTKLSLINALVSQGVNSIVIRVDEPDRFINSEVNYAKAMNEIADAIKQARENNIEVDFYLWARIWLERDGEPNGVNTSIDSAANRVRNWFAPVLDRAKSLGALDKIKGIVLVETNIDRIEDVKDYAKAITDKFNSNFNWYNENAQPFFMSRTFMVPGCGFGLDFRNIGNDNGAFLQQMEGKVKNFAFIYKFMRGAHETVTFDDYYNVPINTINRTWDDMETNSGSFTWQERKAFLEYFGVKELTDYISANENDYPAVSNVVFWGDKWDGISKTPPLSRKALHEVLVIDQQQTGHFFNLASSNTTNTAAIKFYLLEGLTPNQTSGWGGIPVAEEWNIWSTNSANY